MIRGVVFDLDHTLSDRYGTICEIAKNLRGTFRIAEGVDAAHLTKTWIELDKRYVHFGFQKVYTAFASSGLFAEPCPTVDDFVKFHREQFSRIAVPLPYILPLFETLRTRGLKLGLITNGEAFVQRSKLHLLGLENRFDKVLIGGEFGIQKPHHEIFDAMSDSLGIPAEQLMYVGDNPVNDVKGSRGAGYTPVWVRTIPHWSFPDIRMPRYRINTVAELMNFDFDSIEHAD